MSQFRDFLQERIEIGATSTEDALASFLPLMRQVVEAHRRDQVAPLDGVERLRLDGVRIWYEEALNRPPESERRRIEELEKPQSRALEIVGEAKRTSELGTGFSELRNLSVGQRGEVVTQPIYLPGYVCWEHEVGHHDPLTDVFSLGMLLASLACLLDFHRPEHLERFVAHRRNLFRLNPGLHPVLAKAILRMTDLRRHTRAADLETLLRHLESYRCQDVDFDLDLAKSAFLDGASLPTKRHQVLEKLQERLFEISKRNRLLHFRQTLDSVNLTHASVPLSFDVRSIRPDQILNWGGTFASDVLADRPVALNRYLNFLEALYLPMVLDRIRTEAQRDQAEFGFSQMRLVLCFLRWSNLKEKPPERFNTPLLLLPVNLVRKKGIRNTYWLSSAGPEAEVNPVLRFYLRQLYDIELPEYVDLSETSVDDFFGQLSDLILASESAVNLVKVEKPRIDLVHDKARRRLDKYRRLRLSGRGVRTWMDVDYSYDPANFLPLGLQMFRRRILPATTHLREVIQESPRPRRFARPQPEEDTKEVERLFYSVREEGDDNPYNWELDLCNVSLGNFNYQKMTLVRDYRALIDKEPDNRAFDSIFSLRSAEWNHVEATELEPSERYQVVPCDPTQSAAIGLARAGESYIIQGPPGTGKSQTITNLIADFVARGKRVLFVCEKRAAIDVVFQRLQQQQLHQLCCLIYDAQADKKSFVLDLKRTYEGLRSEAAQGGSDCERRRDRILRAIELELGPLSRFHEAMLTEHDAAGVPLHRLLERAIEVEGRQPELSLVQKEALPNLAVWQRSREGIERLMATLADVGGGEVIAEHPLSMLDPVLARLERPVERVTEALAQALPLLDLVEEAVENAGLPDQLPLEGLSDVFAYCETIGELARHELLDLLDRRSSLSVELGARFEEFSKVRDEQTRRAAETVHWKVKLPREEVALALERARSFEGSLFKVFSRDWWQMRRVLSSHYDFAAHSIRPGWRHVLEKLWAEYQAIEKVHETSDALQKRYNLPGDVPAFIARVEDLRSSAGSLNRPASELHRSLLSGEIATETILDLGEVSQAHSQLVSTLEGVVVGFRQTDLRVLRTLLESIGRALSSLPDFVQCLNELAALPREVSTALRVLRHPPRDIEAAVVSKTLEEVYRLDRRVGRFDGTQLRRHCARLEILDEELRSANGGVIRDRVRRRFLEHLELASLPAAQLTSAQKDFKSAYNKGRRELEHEFGKSMRYRSIRDLVSGETGLLVRDLKPVWLMSPLSVSDTLALHSDYFDVVLFDEASQVTLEEAVPSVARAPQVIVVGDQMQLPPTNFFSARRDDGEERVWIEDEGELVEYDLESNSFLSHASRNLRSKMLGWHYRSRFESLISFSNWAFYQGNLLTVPERRQTAADRAEIRAERSEDGFVNVETTLSRPVSFHFMTHGVYERRRNRAEAEYIAQLVRGLLMRDGTDRPSLGIVSFSEAQQDEIEQALNRLAQEDPEFGERLEREREREEDDQFVGLLVKNLENIQGDERDIVIMSVCYGYGPDRRMLMNFGPINQSGGEKRLNVAFSRSKRNMVLVSSIRHSDIKNDYNDGANCLKNYLRYAAGCSVEHTGEVERVLTELALWRHEKRRDNLDSQHAVAEQLANALSQRGFSVLRNLGQSRFRCDLAVAAAESTDLELAIFVDRWDDYAREEILEREVLRPKLLRAFGWKTAHVLAKDWFEDRTRVLTWLERLLSGEEEPPPEGELDLDTEEEGFRGGEPSTELHFSIDHATEELTAESDRSDDAPQPEPVPEVTQAAWTRCFEFIGGGSSKFWEITVAGTSYSVRFGRIGTEGQERIKTYRSPELAEEQALKILEEKVAKGYREKGPPL